MRKMWKRLAGFVMALVMALTLTGAFAENHMTLTREESLVAESGRSIREWEEQVAEAEAKGREASLTLDEMMKQVPDLKVERQNGKIWMLSSDSGLGTIRSAEEAYQKVFSLSALLGATGQPSFRLWSRLSSDHLKVYVFQQVHEGLTVVGSTVRLCVTPDGQLHTVFSSLAHGEVESDAGMVDARTAEDAVRAYLAEQNWKDSVMPEYTSRAVLPWEEETEDEFPPERMVWVVYSRNPRFEDEKVVELPYLVHYVDAAGNYLRGNAVTMPGDPSTNRGYSAAYAFEFMEKGEYTGEVTGQDGSTREITVPVMRDTRTDVWYLADPERKIAVGDFARLAYGDSKVRLISSMENDGWDEIDLKTYDRMIQVWDYYSRYGWKGADGQGTPILMLRDLCLEDGTSMDNAAYMGMSDGWQCFGYGVVTDLSAALDVMAHEYAHCVTESLMNTNFYQDDLGAINEAMSDILGSLCEGILEEGTGDWLIGEDSGMVLRSMLNPHEKDQPEYVWDLYYAPHALSPNDLNDRGGVHFNSSILNKVAAELCVNYGMSLEDARDFWFTVAMGMTPQTDYPQMAVLLPWALEVSGKTAYREALDTLIAKSRMAETGLPGELGEGQRLVTLEMPDIEGMKDGQWILTAFQLDTEALGKKLTAAFDLLGALISGENIDSLTREITELLGNVKLEDLALRLIGEEEEDADVADMLLEAVMESFGGIATQHFTWASGEGEPWTMVVRQRPTLYCLVSVNPEDMELNGFAVLLGDRWVDVASVVEASLENLQVDPELLSDLFWSLGDLIFGDHTTRDVKLPVKGLENIRFDMDWSKLLGMEEQELE